MAGGVSHVEVSCSGIFMIDSCQGLQTGCSYEFRPLVWSRLEQKLVSSYSKRSYAGLVVHLR